MSILITGGAGYIGSHTATHFRELREEIIIADNLRTGHRESVRESLLYEIDIRDHDRLDQIFKKHDIEAVVHFAADSLVGESMVDPSHFYNNNVYGMLCLLDVMRKNQIDKIVFSSTAAVYGEPDLVPICEADRTEPVNTYGETKLAMEKMMKWFDLAYGIKYVSLRYFNAAGAHADGSMGEDHNPETHLIPLILQVPLGKRDSISIFGDDYPTHDGTCIRDYIHVADLADAHHLALEYLRNRGGSDIFNLGNGCGCSVKQVIEAARKVTGHPIPGEVRKRRLGDPAVLVASSIKAQDVLGWKPWASSIEMIIADAWQWHLSHPNGYNK